jgi:hypothetical protein
MLFDIEIVLGLFWNYCIILKLRENDKYEVIVNYYGKQEVKNDIQTIFSPLSLKSLSFGI